jgi:hypothetical protein
MFHGAEAGRGKAVTMEIIGMHIDKPEIGSTAMARKWIE